jgi:MHS family proline/betaine transporter-like MFS transporter
MLVLTAVVMAIIVPALYVMLFGTPWQFVLGQLALGLAGGSAPLVSAWLIETCRQPLAPALYILLHGAIGLVVMWRMPETNTRALND